ncbi:hypothetical protein, partial [Nocardia cyriacigeorgica]|uniref:hypothetical protein n=1 Tax=Nocardia cyriacigeorgica TaxID=135487 RepID=UPI00245775A3
MRPTAIGLPRSHRAAALCGRATACRRGRRGGGGGGEEPPPPPPPGAPDNSDVIVPGVSAVTGMIYAANKTNGTYEITGVDWNTGET